MKNSGFTTTLIVIAILNLFISTTDLFVRIASSVIIVLIAEIISYTHNRKNAIKENNEEDAKDMNENAVTEKISDTHPMREYLQKNNMTTENNQVVLTDTRNETTADVQNEAGLTCKHCGHKRNKYHQCFNCGKGISIKYVAFVAVAFLCLFIAGYSSYSSLRDAHTREIEALKTEFPADKTNDVYWLEVENSDLKKQVEELEGRIHELEYAVDFLESDVSYIDDLLYDLLY